MSNIGYEEIARGVKLMCVNSGKFKTNCIYLDFYMPITDSLAAQYVLSSLMGHSSERYPTLKSFNAAAESLYGADFDSSVATIGEKTRIRFSVELPDDRFSLDGEKISQKAVDFLAEIIKNPCCKDGRFDEELAEREIRFTLENIEAEKNDKRAYAVSRLRQLMCCDEPYGIDRDKLENNVRGLDGKKLFDAYGEMLKKSSVFITACGTVDAQMLKRKFSGLFSGISGREPEKPETVFIEKADRVRYFKETMELSQAKLVLGLRTGMKDSADSYYAYRVMTDIFGGGPYSRLFMNVREKMSLCYYCSARLIRDKGIIFIQSGIEDENYQSALDEINAQLEIMKKGEFTDSEFDSSVCALSDAFSGVEDSPAAVCSYYSSQAFDSEILTGPEFAEKLGSVTREQVTACAQKVTVDSVYLLSNGENGDE